MEGLSILCKIMPQGGAIFSFIAVPNYPLGWGYLGLTLNRVNNQIILTVRLFGTNEIFFKKKYKPAF